MGPSVIWCSTRNVEVQVMPERERWRWWSAVEPVAEAEFAAFELKPSAETMRANVGLSRSNADQRRWPREDSSSRSWSSNNRSSSSNSCSLPKNERAAAALSHCLSNHLYVSLFLSFSLFLHLNLCLPLSVKPPLCVSLSLFLSISAS